MLRRIAEAIDRRPQGYHRRRSILYIAAADFARPLRTRTGAAGTTGVSGWDLSNVAEPAFWSTLLLSLRRRRFAMTLLGQVHLDTAAVPPYAAEKRSAQEVLSATEGIDVDSLVGFVEVAVMRFRPAGTTGAPLVPRDQAQEILRAVLLRGAMVGELRPEAARGAWLASHPESASDPERHWKRAQAHAEELYRSWRGKRKQSPRRLI